MPMPSAKRKGAAAATGRPKKKRAKGASSTPLPEPRQLVEAEALAWRSVGDDFGGLQVVEGVRLVKDGAKVRFAVDSLPSSASARHDDPASDRRPHRPSAQQRPPSHGQLPGCRPAGARAKDDDADDGDQADDGDDDDDAHDNDSLKTKPKTKTRNTAQPPNAPAHPNANSFDALAQSADAKQDDIDMSEWMPLNLSPPILSAIAGLGFTQPTAIQQKAIPEIVAGEDVIGKAQTGSGKTLAFGIPILDTWLERCPASPTSDSSSPATTIRQHSPTALILSPTRELAKQLAAHLKALCDGLPMSPYLCVVTGGLSIQKQQRQLAKADIVIATPGRLWEVLDGDAALQAWFARTSFLVVDEADRLLKDGHFKEMENIIGVLDRRSPESAESDAGSENGASDDELPPRQTLVFSATFDSHLQTRLAGKGTPSDKDGDRIAYLLKRLRFRREPKWLDVNPTSQMADGLKEGLIECGAMEKDLYLYAVLLLNSGRRSLVFANSISAVRRLTTLLQQLGLSVLPLHSQMAQKARLRSLERFAATPGRVLVATDVAARGLDIDQVDLVIHYHVPRSADTYIHRSGRTARGDRRGASIILCAPEEVLPTRRLAGKVHAERSLPGRRQHVIEMVPLDRRLASRLKPRLVLAKRIADAILAKEKGQGEDRWLRRAADDLGLDYDPDELEAAEAAGRGGGRRRREKEARALSKAELGALKARLREELSQRVNLGVSERYIAGGRVDVGALLKERDEGLGGIFLGGTAAELGWNL